MSQHPSLKQNPTLGDLQKYIQAVIEHRGFDKETLQDSFTLLVEEVGELAKAMRKHTNVKIADDSKMSEVSEEAADVFWLLICICNKLDIDLETALRDKEVKNKTRTWR